jgi:hypothetical protein
MKVKDNGEYKSIKTWDENTTSTGIVILTGLIWLFIVFHGPKIDAMHTITHTIYKFTFINVNNPIPESLNDEIYYLLTGVIWFIASQVLYYILLYIGTREELRIYKDRIITIYDSVQVLEFQKQNSVFSTKKSKLFINNVCVGEFYNIENVVKYLDIPRLQ